MSLDSGPVIDQLVRAGLWCEAGSLSRCKRIVLDVDSIVAHLYWLCAKKHRQRLTSIASSKKTGKPSNVYDPYSASLVNYVEYSHHVARLLDFFLHNHIEIILVYQGKFMEAPLFGLTAAQFAHSTRTVGASLRRIRDLEKHHNEPIYSSDPTRQPAYLALNLFKATVNVRRRINSQIRIYQAFYSALPLMAKLARDFKCPVLSNNSNLIMLDIRAGFLLFDEFWFQFVDTETDFALRSSARSPSVTSSSSLPHGKRQKTSGQRDVCNFHLKANFLSQHPGLNAALAMNIFPLNCTDFMVNHSKSLKVLKVYETVCSENDLSQAIPFSRLKHDYKRYQAAANRLEMCLRFLASTNVTTIGNLVRGEATRTNTSFDVDYRQVFNFHAVAFEFKQRLRFILKYLHDPVQLNYIEWCLVDRECTAEYLLELLCCSIGHLASVNYNRHIQLEDLETKKSAFSLQNGGKRMLMSLLSDNKSHKGEHSISKSSSKKSPLADTYTRYSTASLTVIDRQGEVLTEQIIATTHEDPQLNLIRDKLQLDKLAHRKATKQDRAKFINLAFQATDLIHLPPKLDSIIKNHLGADEHHLRNELAIIRSLNQYCLLNAAREDAHFKANYIQLGGHVDVAIVNHYLYLNATIASSKKSSSKSSLSALINLIIKMDFEDVAHVEQPRANKSLPKTSSSKSRTKQTSSQKSQDQPIGKRIIHLLGLLESALQAYCELNSFFDYPMPKLNLHLHYNPILLYNLALYSFEHSTTSGIKALITF